MLPNFILIGATKAGSTSLYYYLKQHPQIFMSTVKEPGYFVLQDGGERVSSTQEEPSLAYTYHDSHDYRALFRPQHGEKAIGEASVGYLHEHSAAGQIAQLIPEARLLLSLRDPVERAYSHFLFDRSRSQQANPNFMELLQQELPILEKPIHWGHEEPTYIRTGFYYRHIQRYLEHFDASQMMIFLFDDLLSRPQELMRDLFTFLNVDDTITVNTAIQHKKSGEPRSQLWHRLLTHANPVGKALRPFLSRDRRRAISTRLNAPNLRKPPFPEEARALLNDLNRSEVAWLQKFLDRDLSSWLSI